MIPRCSQEDGETSFDYIDAHAHLDRYGGSLDSALEEIREHRILTISNSLDVASYKRNREIARSCKLVIPAFGIHPWNAQQYVDKLDELSEHVEDAPVLGEVGLDHYFVKDSSQYPAQLKVCKHFVAESAKCQKVLCLHTKGAESETVELLRRHRPARVIVHWYSGPMDPFTELVALGAYFTVGVEVLRSEKIREIARQIPHNRLLTETDNPGGWEWLAGVPGMPRQISGVVAELARLYDVEGTVIAERVRDNFLRLLGDDRHPV